LGGDTAPEEFTERQFSRLSRKSFRKNGKGFMGIYDCTWLETAKKCGFSTKNI
jgi:hypothetical protein